MRIMSEKEVGKSKTKTDSKTLIPDPQTPSTSAASAAALLQSRRAHFATTRNSLSESWAHSSVSTSHPFFHQDEDDYDPNASSASSIPINVSASVVAGAEAEYTALPSPTFGQQTGSHTCDSILRLTGDIHTDLGASSFALAAATHSELLRRQSNPTPTPISIMNLATDTSVNKNESTSTAIPTIFDDNSGSTTMSKRRLLLPSPSSRDAAVQCTSSISPTKQPRLLSTAYYCCPKSCTFFSLLNHRRSKSFDLGLTHLGLLGNGSSANGPWVPFLGNDDLLPSQGGSVSSKRRETIPLQSPIPCPWHSQGTVFNWNFPSKDQSQQQETAETQTDDNEDATKANILAGGSVGTPGTGMSMTKTVCSTATNTNITSFYVCPKHNHQLSIEIEESSKQQPGEIQIHQTIAEANSGTQQPTRPQGFSVPIPTLNVTEKAYQTEESIDSVESNRGATLLITPSSTCDSLCTSGVPASRKEKKSLTTSSIYSSNSSIATTPVSVSLPVIDSKNINDNHPPAPFSHTHDQVQDQDRDRRNRETNESTGKEGDGNGNPPMTSRNTDEDNCPPAPNPSPQPLHFPHHPPSQPSQMEIHTLVRNADRKRRFFARNQTNSAPESSRLDQFYFSNFILPPSCSHHEGQQIYHHDFSPNALVNATIWESELRNLGTSTSSTSGSTTTVVGVTHVSELDYPDADPPCHFCCEQASTAIHDETRLQIVSGGLVRRRDGSTRSGSAPYINLPSPNVQTEDGQSAATAAAAVMFGTNIDLSSPSICGSQQTLLSPNSIHHHLQMQHNQQQQAISNQQINSNSCNAPGTSKDKFLRQQSSTSVTSTSIMDDEAPPASSLVRRPALVPPKLIPDHHSDYEHDSGSGGGDRNSSRHSSDDTSSITSSTSPSHHNNHNRTRRSSFVVIPPSMQICPGDLLVYGKVLSQRKSLLSSGSSMDMAHHPSPVTVVTSMFDHAAAAAAASDQSASSSFSSYSTASASKGKPKASWSLMKLFERSSRTKSGGCTSSTLEEIMTMIQPCDFSDPKLTRFKGMTWMDFIAHVKKIKTKTSDSNYSVASGSSSEGSMSPMTTAGVMGDSKVVTSVPTAPTTTVSTTTTTTTTTSSSPIHSLLMKGKKDKDTSGQMAPSKPLIRKRMGLMRTMSDRCLERRFTPALWKSNALMSDKLVEEKKETEGATGATSTANTPGNDDPGKIGQSSPKGAPRGLQSMKSEKDLLGTTPTSESASTPGTEESDTENPRKSTVVRQREALWDLFQSECSFLYDHLMVLKNVFMEPMKRIQVEGFAMYAEPELLFGNLDELCCVTYAFCKEFIHLLLKETSCMGDLSPTRILGKLFEQPSSTKARAMSQSYHRYALNYINALNYLETLRRHSEFTDFEKLCMRDPRCKKLQLTDLLVSPVQHIMKVPLILKDIQSRTNEPEEKELIVQILEIQENSIRELDDKMRWLKNFERLLEIQRNIVWPSIIEMEPKTWIPEFLRSSLSRQPCDGLIVSPRRQIINEGLLQLWDTGKPSETYLILFDDMLLITRRKKGLSKKKSSLTENWATTCSKSPSSGGPTSESNHRYIVYRQPISLDRFFIHDITEGENVAAKLDYAFVLVSLNRFQQIVAVHTFQAPTEAIKATWLQKMKVTQDKWKRTLQNTVFRGVVSHNQQRSSTDSGQSTSSMVFHSSCGQ